MQGPSTSCSGHNAKKRVAMAKLPGNANKKRLNSQDDDSVSHFAPSGLEDESGRDEDNTFA